MTSERKGLYGKYIIEKANGEPLDPEAKYFVLRYDKGTKDSAAKEAMWRYAFLCEDDELRVALIKELKI